MALGFDRESQKAFAKKISMDPFRFVAVTIGSTLLGAPEIVPGVKDFLGSDKVKAFLSKPIEVPLSLKVLKAQRGETFEGMYGTSVKQSSYGDFFREYKLAKLAKKLDIDTSALTQFEREIGLQFPEETTGFTSTARLFERKSVIKTYGKNVALEAPYMLETNLETYIDPDVLKIMLDEMRAQDVDMWAPAQITVSKPTAIGYVHKGTGGFVKTEGSYSAMKPFKFTEPVNPLIGTTKAPSGGSQALIQVPSKAVKAGKNIVTGAFPQQQSWVTGFSEEVVTYAPGVDLRSTFLQAPKAMVPSLFPTLPISALSTITGIVSTQRQEIKQTQAQTQKQAQKIADLTMPKLGNILSPKSVQAISQPQVQIPWMEQKPVQIPKQIQFTVPSMTPIQTPAPSMPKFTIPNIPLTPFKPSPPIRVRAEPSKKKKTKSKKKRKTAYERRVDPLKNLLKKVKVPKYG